MGRLYHQPQEGLKMNVTDLRKALRRSQTTTSTELKDSDRRKVSDRRSTEAEPGDTDGIHRIWLTPGEKTLIEDIYLLDEDTLEKKLPPEADAEKE